MNNREIDMDRLNTDIIDPQIRLAKALDDLDIKEFRNTLTVVEDLLAIDDQHFCIYERALGKCGAAEFVSECLKAGCDPNHVNKYYNKAAIHFAIDSMDPDILRILLREPGVQVNHEYQSLTPLHHLARKLNAFNYERLYQCVKVLLEYEACINKPDQIEILSLLVRTFILYRAPFKLLQELLNIPNIDIDTYGQGKLRHILEMEYPKLKLPAKSQTTKITFYTLLNCIKFNDMEMFVQQYKDETRYTTKEEDQQLLVESIIRGAHQAFDALLEEGVDYNFSFKCESLFEIACKQGNPYALDKLLTQTDICVVLTSMLYLQIFRKLSDENYRQQFDNYWKCFYILLASEKISVNVQDISGSTPLHYAVKYHNHWAIRELLACGAVLGITNNYNELPFEGISPLVLEKHLDECIAAYNGRYRGKDYKIAIDFKNFKLSLETSKIELDEVLIPIAFIGKSKEYRHILQHPVIKSILYLKWLRISSMFYANFFLYLFFLISMVSYCILKYRASEDEYVVARVVAQYCSWLGICYLMVREFLELILSPLNYLSKLSNYIDISVIVYSIVIILGITSDCQRNITVFCILLMAYKLIILIGALPFPTLSIQVLMLKAVSKSFLTIFLFYSIFFVIFTLCFYIKCEDLTVAKDNDTEEVFHRFSNFSLAFAKTIVMFTGEFDTDSMQLQSNYLLFAIFVLFMTIILFNLLNGLAVSDTQAIQNQAEYNEIFCLIDLLTRFENIIFKQKGLKFMSYLLRKYFPYSTLIRMFITPNDGNHIYILDAKIKPIEAKTDDLENHKLNGKVAEVVIPKAFTEYKPNKIFLTIFKEVVPQAIVVLRQPSRSITENHLEKKMYKMIADLKLQHDKKKFN